jgi:hypothetical protein
VAAKIRLKQEADYGYKILSNVRGIIGVTNEIRNFELSRAGSPIPSITIPNGILVDRVNFTGFNPFDGKNLHLVTIMSSPYPWNGLDRIISSINRYSGSVNIRLHLIGRIAKNDIKPFGLDFSKVTFHGYQTGDALDCLMHEMNLALSPLALYRVGMIEASTLIIREYTARGIPFVVAYKDPDLHQDDEYFRFYMESENEDKSIDVDKIIDFAAQVSRKGRILSDYMRNYAYQHMDWSSKMSRYLDFVKQIHSGGGIFNDTKMDLP